MKWRFNVPEGRLSAMPARIDLADESPPNDATTMLVQLTLRHNEINQIRDAN